jgi:two-component system response regulator FixJ
MNAFPTETQRSLHKAITAASAGQQISVVDDDARIRDQIYALLHRAGFPVRTYASARHFLADYVPAAGCLVADMTLPDMGGMELLEELAKRSMDLPVIFIASHADIPTVVRAMKSGAVNFLQKPLAENVLIAGIEDALRVGQYTHKRAAEVQIARETLAQLTPREQHVLDQLVRGHSNKSAAYALGISTRTVEFHRARIMSKLNARNMTDLLRVALTVEQSGIDVAFAASIRQDNVSDSPLGSANVYPLGHRAAASKR